MKKFWTMFDDNNTINEKAVVGFIAFAVMILFAAVDIGTGIANRPLLVNEFIFNSFEVITIACFGIASVDKWINKKHNLESETEENGNS